MHLILILLIVALLAALFFSSGFRSWLWRQLTAIWTLIQIYFPVVSRIVRIYYMIILGIAAFAFLLMMISLPFQLSSLTAFAFVLAISAVLLAWLPIGIVLRTLRATSSVIPKILKTFVAYVAFVGFIGLMYPDAISFKTMLGAALVGFICLGVTAKINLLDKIIFPLVIFMCLVAVWKYVSPDGFRSTVRYASSWSKQLNTHKDRGSIRHETDAATTYGIILKDVDILYTLSDAGLSDVTADLAKGTIVKLADHKEEVKIIDGQGFVQIQLAKANKSFVRGKKYWIEAEFVQLASPRDITPEEDISHNANKAVTVTSQADTIAVLYPGARKFDLVDGKSTGWLTLPKFGKFRYSISSPNYNYKIIFSDGKEYAGGPNTVIPWRERPIFKVIALDNETISVSIMKV